MARARQRKRDCFLEKREEMLQAGGTGTACISLGENDRVAQWIERQFAQGDHQSVDGDHQFYECYKKNTVVSCSL